MKIDYLCTIAHKFLPVTNHWFNVDGYEYALVSEQGQSGYHLITETFAPHLDDTLKAALIDVLDNLPASGDSDPAEAYHDHLAFEADDKNDFAKLYS